MATLRPPATTYRGTPAVDETRPDETRPDETRPDVTRPDVTRIDQVAIAVADLDEALAFYERAFGLSPTSRERIERDGVEEAMIDIGGVHLQLLQPTRDDSPIARFLERHGPGLHHLGFGVASVAAALEHLQAHEVAVIDQEPRIGGGGHTIGFVHPKGTGGVLIELVEDQ